MNNIINPYINSSSDMYQRKPETCHHILPKSRGGSCIEDNKVKLYENIHSSLHCLFWNLTIREQLCKMLSIAGTAIGKDFKEDIFKILKETENEYYYKDWIYLKK